VQNPRHKSRQCKQCSSLVPRHSHVFNENVGVPGDEASSVVGLWDTFIPTHATNDAQGSRSGHIYTCSTDTHNRDQSEIKRSSCEIGHDQVIKTSVYAAEINIKMGLVPRLHLYPAHPRLAIKGQGSFSGTIKRSRSKNGPDQILIPVAGVSTAGIYVTTPWGFAACYQ
jgi:hypothetical protein